MGGGVCDMALVREVTQCPCRDVVIALRIGEIESANQFLCFRTSLGIVGATECFLPECGEGEAKHFTAARQETDESFDHCADRVRNGRSEEGLGFFVATRERP